VNVPPQQGIRVTLPQQAVTGNAQGASVGRGNDLECRI
jgi:hypothetical protein